MWYPGEVTWAVVSLPTESAWVGSGTPQRRCIYPSGLYPPYLYLHLSLTPPMSLPVTAAKAQQVGGKNKERKIRYVPICSLYSAIVALTPPVVYLLDAFLPTTQGQQRLHGKAMSSFGAKTVVFVYLH